MACTCLQAEPQAGHAADSETVPTTIYIRMFRMPSHYGFGIVIFLKNIFARKERDYEARFPWSLQGGLSHRNTNPPVSSLNGTCC